MIPSHIQSPFCRYIPLVQLQRNGIQVEYTIFPRYLEMKFLNPCVARLELPHTQITTYHESPERRIIRLSGFCRPFSFPGRFFFFRRWQVSIQIDSVQTEIESHVRF